VVAEKKNRVPEQVFGEENGRERIREIEQPSVERESRSDPKQRERKGLLQENLKKMSDITFNRILPDPCPVTFAQIPTTSLPGYVLLVHTAVLKSAAPVVKPTY
jgi:hypothetical protein